MYSNLDNFAQIFKPKSTLNDQKQGDLFVNDYYNIQRVYGRN